jgi:excisionase family DNA binding protein
VRDLEPIFTIEEAAERLKISSKTVRRLIKKIKLRASLVSGQYRIRQSAIEEYLDGTQVRPQPTPTSTSRRGRPAENGFQFRCLRPPPA